MPPVLTHKNRQLYVDLGPLVSAGLESTHLTADAAAAASTITVKDIDNFAVNQILLIGELGSEGSEIVKTHASTAPSGTTITLTAGMEFAHGSGTKVYLLQYDQIEFSHATTATGSKSVLATKDIQADQLIQAYTDTSQTTGFYFARFKDSIASTFGSYSDALEYGGWDPNTVGSIIDQALRENKTTLSDIITREDCYRWLSEGLRFIQGKQVHYPEHQSLNTIIGQASRGSNVVSLPSDIYDTQTLKSVISVRIGENEDLEALDPKEFEERLGEVVVTQVRTQAVATDTTLALDNSYDFADSGSVNVYISGTKYTITYTGVTRDTVTGGTAALTGIPASGTGAITVTIPVDTYVWQNQEEGQPDSFTLRNGALEYYPLVDAANDNKNVYMDYFTVATSVDSDGDTIDVARYDMLLDYLTWRIRMKDKNNGALDMSDGYFQMFKEKLNDAIRTNRSVFKHKMKPNVNRIRY